MPELFREMYYGPNVQNLVESDDCKVMRLSDNSGEGMMTLYYRWQDQLRHSQRPFPPGAGIHRNRALPAAGVSRLWGSLYCHHG